MAEHLEAVPAGDADIFSIPGPAGDIPAAVGDDGTIYLSGDLHPAGAAVAMAIAESSGIPFIPVGAVEALFPLPWLAAAALGASDSARVAIIGRLERYIRSRG